MIASARRVNDFTRPRGLPRTGDAGMPGHRASTVLGEPRLPRTEDAGMPRLSRRDRARGLVGAAHAYGRSTVYWRHWNT